MRYDIINKQEIWIQLHSDKYNLQECDIHEMKVNKKGTTFIINSWKTNQFFKVSYQPGNMVAYRTIFDSYRLRDDELVIGKFKPEEVNEKREITLKRDNLTDEDIFRINSWAVFRIINSSFVDEIAYYSVYRADQVKNYFCLGLNLIDHIIEIISYQEPLFEEVKIMASTPREP